MILHGLRRTLSGGGPSAGTGVKVGKAPWARDYMRTLEWKGSGHNGVQVANAYKDMYYPCGRTLQMTEQRRVASAVATLVHEHKRISAVKQRVKTEQVKVCAAITSLAVVQQRVVESAEQKRVSDAVATLVGEQQRVALEQNRTSIDQQIESTLKYRRVY